MHRRSIPTLLWSMSAAGGPNREVGALAREAVLVQAEEGVLLPLHEQERAPPIDMSRRSLVSSASGVAVTGDRRPRCV